MKGEGGRLKIEVPLKEASQVSGNRRGKCAVGDELRRVKGHAADAAELAGVAVHGGRDRGAGGFVGAHTCGIVHIASQLLLVGA